MEPSDDVAAGLMAFYNAFNTGDPARFDEALALGAGVSVIGSAPDEGNSSREGWLDTYADFISAAGLKIQGGGGIQAYAGGDTGFALDTPSFVVPGGARLPTRLTAVLTLQDGTWRMVHAHFSVGVPDEDALVPPKA